MYPKQHRVNYGFPIIIIGDGKVAQAYVDGKQAIKGFVNPITVVGKGTNAPFFKKRGITYQTPESVRELVGSVILAVRPQNGLEVLSFVKEKAHNPRLVTSLISGITFDDIKGVTGIHEDCIATATLNVNIRYRSGIVYWHDRKKYTPGKMEESIFGQTFGGLTSPGRKCPGYLKKVHADNKKSADEKILDAVVLVGSGVALHTKAIWLAYEKEAVKQKSLKKFLGELAHGSYPQIIQKYFEVLNAATMGVFGTDYTNLNRKSFHSTVSALNMSPYETPLQIGEHIKGVVTRGGCTETKLADMSSVRCLQSVEKMSDVLYGIREKSLCFREIALGVRTT